jgi:hypothetical protein
MLLAQLERRAASRADWIAGISNPIKIPMIATTTNSSTSVKPRRAPVVADMFLTSRFLIISHLL